MHATSESILIRGLEGRATFFVLRFLWPEGGGVSLSRAEMGDGAVPEWMDSATTYIYIYIKPYEIGQESVPMNSWLS